MKVLVECISKANDVVQLTSKGHPDLPLHLTNLAIARHKQFQQTQSPETLVEAVENIKKAIAKKPPDHYSLANSRSSLAIYCTAPTN